MLPPSGSQTRQRCGRREARQERRKRRQEKENPPTGGEQRGEPPAGGVQPGEPPTGGIQPDIVVLEGWPETANPPEGPATTWVSQEGVRRAVRIRIGELACTSDLQPHKAVARKREKYRPLVLALREARWNVVDTVHVVTVGVRGTVPLANKAELGCLGITTKKEQLVTQRAMAREAIIRHLNIIIVRQYRKLSGRRGNKKEGGGTGAKNRHTHTGRHLPNDLIVVCNERVGIV